MIPNNRLLISSKPTLMSNLTCVSLCVASAYVFVIQCPKPEICIFKIDLARSLVRLRYLESSEVESCALRRLSDLGNTLLCTLSTLGNFADEIFHLGHTEIYASRTKTKMTIRTLNASKRKNEHVYAELPSSEVTMLPK